MGEDRFEFYDPADPERIIPLRESAMYREVRGAAERVHVVGRGCFLYSPW
jgi:hypothetical protein